MAKRKTLEDMQQGVDAFNEICRPGDKVIVKLDNGEDFRTTVRYPAEVLSGHTPVVWLNGIRGCYILSRVTVASKTMMEDYPDGQ